MTPVLAAVVALAAGTTIAGPPARRVGAVDGGFTSVVPQRVLDTRSGQGAVTGPTAPGVPVPIPLASVPEGSAAAVLQLSIVDPVAGGWATAFPCGAAVPFTANVNFAAHQTVGNLVIARPGDGGAVCVATSAPAQVVADLQGWFAPGSYVPEQVPTRALDTRETRAGLVPGTPQVILGGGAGRAAVVANVTMVQPAGAGFVTVYPCGGAVPLASNVNAAAGDVVGNLVVGAVGDGGNVCARANVATDLVVDVQGWVPVGTTFAGIAPVRMADTRSPIGVQVAAKLVPGQPVALPFPIHSGIPTNVATAVLDVAVTQPDRAGFVTVYPCGGDPPLTSNLNFAAGETRAGLSITGVGGDGTVCLRSNVATHVVVDLQGWFAAPGQPVDVSTPRREHVDITPDLAMGYLAYVPAGYDSSPGRTWPTIVFLHGSGETGTGVGDDLDRVESNGLPVLYAQQIEPAVAAGFVVLAPQSPVHQQSAAILHTWLAQVLPRYHVDRDRLYLTGLSAGGFGTYGYVAAYGDANEFAAAVPIAGGYNLPLACASWRRTPIWAFHGSVDPQVSTPNDIGLNARINACAPAERARITIYPGVGHEGWTATYDLSGMAPGATSPAFDPYDVDMYTWLLAHVRSAYR